MVAALGCAMIAVGCNDDGTPAPLRCDGGVDCEDASRPFGGRGGSDSHAGVAGLAQGGRDSPASAGGTAAGTTGSAAGGGTGAAGSSGAAGGSGSGAGAGGIDAMDADSGTDLDDAGVNQSASLNGSYQCRVSGSFGNSCQEPLVAVDFNGGDYWWTLEVADESLTITSIGFDTEQLHCEGIANNEEFSCTLAWSRAGRSCSAVARLSRNADASLHFQLGAPDVEQARCSRE